MLAYGNRTWNVAGPSGLAFLLASLAKMATYLQGDQGRKVKKLQFRNISQLVFATIAA